MEKQMNETKSRLKDWWEDVKALGRPLVLCQKPSSGHIGKHWGYFTYAQMLVELLGNDKLKAQIRAAQDAPYREIPPLPKAPTGFKINYEDPAHAAIINQVKNQIEAEITSAPFGDTIPIIRSQAGPGFPGCCMGEYSCIPTNGPNTIWYETPRRWDELKQLELDYSSPWWQFMVEITRKQLEWGPDWLSVGFLSMSGTTDILQSLRGTQKMLRDMLTEKARVKQVLDQINLIYQETVDRFWEIIKQKRDGTGSFIGIWAPGNAPSIQCDALAYLGPKQFKEFALPYIIKDLEHADYGTYHLDGPGAIKYLHDLLEIPKLDLIQWVQGAGNPDGVALKWYPLVKKVLEKGKRILLYTHIDRIPFFIRRLKSDGVDPRGIVFSIGPVRDFEVKEFLPWMDLESNERDDAHYYSEEFWPDYDAMLQEDTKTYEDLYTGSMELDLHYEK
jgi:hypothetical protein